MTGKETGLAYRKLTDDEQERFALASERLRELPAEKGPDGRLGEFFLKEAAFLLEMDRLRISLLDGSWENVSGEELEKRNRELYGELAEDRYAGCPGNPSHMGRLFGEKCGAMLSMLYAELRGAIVYAFENRPWDLLILMELLLQVYCLFRDSEDRTAAEDELRDVLYWYISDYSREITEERTEELLDPAKSFIRDRIMTADLSDLRYLYTFGEYVTDSEKKTAAWLNSLPEDEIEQLARIWTEGYRLGFLAQKKDISIKKTVEIRARLGFERIVRCAVRQFSGMGLETIIYRSASHAVVRRQHLRIGWYGAVPNRQYEYDHRNDAAIWLDERFVTRRLQDIQGAYEHCREQAAVFGGPACMETFGEKPFSPEEGNTLLRLTDGQQRLQVRLAAASSQITNRYIPGEERSFTIIAWPVPGIGDRFEEIFREVMRINTLDNHTWQQIQQHLIDALDQGERVHILGRNGNETDLTVRLHPLRDPSKETNFENCTADVNIPAGEVFTSPLLAGTNGVLHVREACLGSLRFRDLRLEIKDGMTASCSCANFDSVEENLHYIEENILFHHPSLPVGEFAIGTNTTAWRAARKYGIADRLPILIAEKMGPHFAFGDTCYSRQEDMPVFNPDGKEIIARDNERSILRKTDPEKAYFGCHTDITIPYDELGSIIVYGSGGLEIPLIGNGRFVLPGTEMLNLALDNADERKTDIIKQAIT